MTQAIDSNSRNRPLRLIPCADACNRRRTVRLSPELSTGRIALVTPPGESAVLSPHEASVLAQELLALAEWVERQYAAGVRLVRKPTG